MLGSIGLHLQTPLRPLIKGLDYVNEWQFLGDVKYLCLC